MKHQLQTERLVKNTATIDDKERVYLLAQGFSPLAVDALSRERQVKASDLSTKWFFFLGTSYVVALMLYLILYGVAAQLDWSISIQLANVSTLAAVLFILGVLFRPKPTQPNRRFYFTLAELLFPACFILMSLLLFKHPGWESPEIPDGGAVAATIWPFVWVGVWLGPQLLSFLLLVLAHFVIFKLKVGFYLYKVEQLRLVAQQNYFEYYQQALKNDTLIPENQRVYCARHISRFLTDTKTMQESFPLTLYNEQIKLEIIPLGQGDSEIKYTTENTVDNTYPKESKKQYLFKG